MDLYYNNQKVTTYNFDPTTTVGSLKESLKQWLNKHGVFNYSIRIIFKDGSEVSPKIFRTDKYDSSNFKNHYHKGGYIYITSVNREKGLISKRKIVYPWATSFIEWILPQLLKLNIPVKNIDEGGDYYHVVIGNTDINHIDWKNLDELDIFNQAISKYGYKLVHEPMKDNTFMIYLMKK